MKVILMVFAKKVLFVANKDISGPKMVHPQTLDLQ